MEDELTRIVSAIDQGADAVAVHDVNNILTAINGYAMFVADALPDESPIREDVDEITRAANRAATLTRQLLAFSRRQILQPVVLDMNEVVAEMTPMLRRVLGVRI